MLYPAVAFQGNCLDAIRFYESVLGAQVKSIALLKDAPPDSGMSEQHPPDFVMDSEVVIDGVSVMMTDGGAARPTSDYFSFALLKDSDDETRAVFDKLAQGGKVLEPLAPVFWSSLYGTLEDRFGVTWMVMTR